MVSKHLMDWIGMSCYVAVPKGGQGQGQIPTSGQLGGEVTLN